MAKPLILVTNDDGINAPGIRTLISVMKDVGDIIVVAPDSPQSGMGHAITINSTLHSSRITPKDSEVIEYSCSGTPADCVKLAINELMPRKPDLCVSGINHGSNSSINVIYSGTMSAAIEAGIEGVPAIGFSLLDYRWDANFSESKDFIKKGVVLNVNIPSVEKSKIKGVKVCRQANASWVEEFDKRKNPLGQEYYWLTGKFINKDNGEDTDEWALNQNYISIVPVEFDLTAHHAIQELNEWNFK
jgi:5'-nucleotidase